MQQEERIVNPRRQAEDLGLEVGLRPRHLAEFVGQEEVRRNLEIALAAAKARGEAVDHILVHGPPGLGKTTLAYIIANEMGGGIKATSGPVVERAGDLAALLTNLAPHDVSSSTKSTGCPRWWRKSSTPPWRTSAWTSSSAKGPGPGP